MASDQSTPSRKLKYEQHILQTQSRTPPRYNATSHTLRPAGNSDSSGSNPSSSSDPPKSFLALSAESSPTTTQGPDSSPYSAAPLRTNSVVAARAAALLRQANSPTSSRSRIDAAESSFFAPAATSPAPSRTTGSASAPSTNISERQGAVAPRLQSDAKVPPISRGSRLGAQMGRTRSEQTSTISRNEDFKSIASTSTSPLRNNANDTSPTSRIGSLSARMNRELRSHSPSSNAQAPERAERADTDAVFASKEALRNGVSPSSLRGPVRNTDAAVQGQVLSPTSQSSLARRTEAEKLGQQSSSVVDEHSAMPLSATLPPLPELDSQDQGGEFSRSSSQGDLYSAPSSNVTSPTGSTRGGASMAAPRTGRLSRLQYNKAEPVVSQSGPSWDMSAASSRNALLAARPNLVGRVSNPNMLADFRRGEQSGSSEASQWVETSRSNSNSGTAPDDASGQKLDSANMDGITRPAERRELMLPQLNGMRNAVESVLSTSTETFLKKGERRRSSFVQQQSVPSSDDRVNGEQSGLPMSPKEAALANEWHRRTPSLETNATSPATTEETWMRVNGAHHQVEPTNKDDFPLSSSPPSSSVTTTRGAAAATLAGRDVEQLKRRTSIKVGQLTDKDIVELGAVPGIEPSSLLNPHGAPLSSKNILTIALQKAQSAVLLDSANNVPDAISAYQQAVRLLEEVMERVSPKNTSNSRRKSSREEERRRLKVIHDTYADRIRLLSMISRPVEQGEAGDSSVGEESFARQSPTPIRTIKSQDARMLNGLGILDDKSVGQTPPQISIAEADGSPTTRTEAREELLDGSGARLERHASLHGSDSEGSFRSARDPVSRPSVDGISAFSSVSDRLALRPLRDSVGMENDLVPVTPYFDTDQGTEMMSPSRKRLNAAGEMESQINARPVSKTTVDDLAFESGGKRRSRSPQDRISRGMSSLNNVPSATDIAANDRIKRFLSIGSQAQFQSEVSPSSPLRKGLEEDQATSPSLGNRPRALTMGVNEQGRMLVSATVTSGVISQRRKASGLKNSDDDIFRSDGRAPSRAELLNGSNIDEPAGAKLASSSEDDAADQSESLFNAGRKRAISQPSNRRPSIPASFMPAALLHSGSSQGLPPVPKIKRKSSMPLSPLVFQQQQQGTLKAASSSAAGFRFPSPAPSASSGYHALGTPSTVFGQYPWCNPATGEKGSESVSSVMSDLFPSSLPSLQMGAVPSYTSNSYPVHLPWIGVTSALPESTPFTLPPAQKSLRPFYVMKLLQNSIERGSYITKRLYLSRDLWLQSGSRLLAIETKVRMLDSISSGIDGIEQAGLFLLHPSHTDQPGLNAINASKFLKLLEEFETLLIEVQNTLAKKLGFLETVDGKKSGSSFGSFSSKLTRSLDRMTNNAKSHIDTPANYVDGLSRLFVKAQVIGEHLRTLDRSKRELESPTKDSEWDSIDVEMYATLPAELKRSIELKLKKASEFFNNVILRFVLRDVAILVDKSVKRNTVLLTE